MSAKNLNLLVKVGCRWHFAVWWGWRSPVHNTFKIRLKIRLDPTLPPLEEKSWWQQGDRHQPGFEAQHLLCRHQHPPALNVPASAVCRQNCPPLLWRAPEKTTLKSRRFLDLISISEEHIYMANEMLSQIILRKDPEMCGAWSSQEI